MPIFKIDGNPRDLFSIKGMKFYVYVCIFNSLSFQVPTNTIKLIKHIYNGTNLRALFSF